MSFFSVHVSGELSVVELFLVENGLPIKRLLVDVLTVYNEFNVYVNVIMHLALKLDKTSIDKTRLFVAH